MTDHGRTYHLSTRKGELSNLIVTVGDHARARKIASLFQSTLHTISSKRGFLTITGYYKDKIVSVVGIGMGISMMDFFVREAKAVVEGEMVIIRLGSCGGLSSALVGDIVVCDSSILVQRNPNAFLGASSDCSFTLSEPFNADRSLTLKLKECLDREMSENVHVGLNATADSFYSTQGRTDLMFNDKNENIISSIKEKYPDIMTLEMETFMLLHLARCCKEPIRASACAMVFAERMTNKFISPDEIEVLEKKAAVSVLNTLVEFE